MNVELDDQIRLREIFCVARNVLQAEDRAKLLDERCGGDKALRQQVERLLAAVSDQKKVRSIGPTKCLARQNC